MSVIILLLSVSVFIAACFLAAFLWSVNTGQYEDDYSPPYRILFDDPAEDNEQKPESTNKE